MYGDKALGVVDDHLAGKCQECGGLAEDRQGRVVTVRCGEASVADWRGKSKGEVALGQRG